MDEHYKIDEHYKELIESIKQLTIEVQKQNVSKQLPGNRDIIYFVKRYVQEVIEASFALAVVMFIMKKPFVWNDFFKIVGLVGMVTLILEEYNMDAADNFKQGIYYTLGAVAYGSS